MIKVNTGICGPYSIGKVIGKPYQQIIDEWIGGYKGFAPMKEMKAMLDKYGILYKTIQGKKSKYFDLHGYDLLIARIQWDGEYGHWAEAQQYTHYVTLKRENENTALVYCDGAGVFEANTNGYLDDGHITSYLAILL